MTSWIASWLRALNLAGVDPANIGAIATPKSRRREATRAQILKTLAEANAFFSSTPSEPAIRQRLADFVNEITGTGALFVGVDGQLLRSPAARHWRGAQEAELTTLAKAAMLRDARQPIDLGVFRASAVRSATVFGAAVWLSPPDGTTAARHVDEQISLLISLASAGIARCRISPAPRLKLVCSR